MLQVDALLEMLMAAELENGEGFLHDGFSGIGAGIDIHKLLRTNGFVSRHLDRLSAGEAHLHCPD